MLFTHETNADQFNIFPCDNLRGVEANSQRSSCTEMDLRDTNSNSRVTGLGKENIYGKSEESSFGKSLKDASSISPGKPGDNCQSSTVDHDKRPLSDAKPCQIAWKRPKQTDNDTGLYSFEERPFGNADNIPASVMGDEFVESRQLEHVPANNGTTTCSDSSTIPCLNRGQLAGLESLHLPDWVISFPTLPDWATSFPGYFEDCGINAGCNTVNHIDSPVHEYLPRKDVPIGPEHQADIPEWRPRVAASVPGASGSCADMAYSSVSSSEYVHTDDDSESDKWVRHSVIPMSTFPFDCIKDNKIDCDCSDEGSVRCVGQHILEARESLKRSLGQDKFRDLGLCEMGEVVSQGWTDDEEKQFQREVFSNPISLGKNFWDYLPRAFPGKSSKELVSYYFNVFMLRKRAQQNRSDLLRVDSDDDELPDEPPEQEKEDSAVESPSREHFTNNSVSIEDVHEPEGRTHPCFFAPLECSR
ncbi:hypothetical protein EJB05_06061 [Eragrostis curvula]|uniref:Myb-like domain-containing protein n=1 Tax=Eragrostis curvula TaxID=38414 RepID=A0A5J9WGI5_9POAL|nr:hypothetical protein EJB05_06061 [Eragrostis curvula]